MSSSDDEAARRALKSDLIRSGWPDSSTYSQGFQYSPKIRAVQVHEDFLDRMTDMCLAGRIDKNTLMYLGPCAKENTPRAMYLLGVIESDEGGGDTTTELPSFWEWPVIKGIED